MKRLKMMSVIAVTAVLLSGCSTVKLKPGAAEVELLEAARVKNCKRLGQTSVSVAQKFGFIKRGEKAIRADLQTLARNSAMDMGGDTITPQSGIENGEQKFGVYDCI